MTKYNKKHNFYVIILYKMSNRNLNQYNSNIIEGIDGGHIVDHNDNSNMSSYHVPPPFHAIPPPPFHPLGSKIHKDASSKVYKPELKQESKQNEKITNQLVTGKLNHKSNEYHGNSIFDHWYHLWPHWWYYPWWYVWYYTYPRYDDYYYYTDPYHLADTYVPSHEWHTIRGYYEEMTNTKGEDNYYNNYGITRLLLFILLSIIIIFILGYYASKLEKVKI